MFGSPYLRPCERQGRIVGKSMFPEARATRNPVIIIVSVIVVPLETTLYLVYIYIYIYI